MDITELEQEAPGNEAEWNVLALFLPMIKSSIRKRYLRGLADRAVKKGRLGYRRLAENAPELGKLRRRL